VYTARTRPRTGRVHRCTRAVSTAVHDPCARPCTRTRLVHGRVHGRVDGLYTAVYTLHYRVHDRVWAMYTAVYTGRIHRRLCTRIDGRVHGPIDGRVHGRVHGLYMAVYRHRSRRHEAAAASHIYVTSAPPPVIFVRVQVSRISCGCDALKLSGLLIFKRIKLIASTTVPEQNGPKMGPAVPLSVGELGPYVTLCRLGRGLPPYQVAS